MGVDLGIPEAATAVAATTAAEAGATAAAATAATAAGAGTAAAASAIPAWLSYAGIASTALSGITGAAGALQSASAQQRAALYQGTVASNNATIAKQQADTTAAAGEAAATASGMKTRSTVGAIKAAQAASGVDVDSGSAVDVRSSEAELGQLDSLTLRSNFARNVFGFQSQATNFQAESGLDTQKAAEAPIGGAFGAAGSILSGASGVANQFTRFKQNAGAANSSGFF